MSRSLPSLELDIGSFSSASVLDGTSLRLHLVGEADTVALEALDSLLRECHAQAGQVQAREVVLDLTKLGFMSSSCFTKLIAWVNRVRGLEADSRYHIRIRSNSEMLWQRKSLHALQCFATDLISIDS
jgi:hypothetical protein